MSEILVHLRPASAAGRLYPKLGSLDVVIAASSALRRGWPYGVNIDDQVICDLDENHILANFEALMPRRRWKVMPDLALPQRAKAADLEFSQEAIDQQYFSLPCAITTNAAKSYVQIRFGSEASEIRWVALSEQCFAALAENDLKGFLLLLT